MLNLTSNVQITLIKLFKTAVLLCSILLFQLQAAEKTLDKNDVNELIDKTMHVMHQNYIDSSTLPNIEQSIKLNFEIGKYSKLNTLDEFAKTIGDDIRVIADDDHLSMFTVNPSDEITHVIKHSEGKLTYNYAFEELRYLHGNIGYLKFNKFHPSDKARDTVDASFSFLKNSTALVIDLRDAVGGSPKLVQYILSHFFPKGTALWEVHNKNNEVTEMINAVDVTAGAHFQSDYPVWILVSRNSASSAELFAGVLQANKRAVVVGEVTAGAGFYVGVRNITPELVFRISVLKPIFSVNKKGWEKVGIIPDIKVPAIDAMAYTKQAMSNRN